MFGILLKRELIENFLNLRLPLATMLFVSLSTASAFLGHRDYSKRMQNHLASLQVGADQLYADSYTQTYPIDATNTLAVLPQGLVREPHKLSIMVRGGDLLMGQTVKFFDAFPLVEVTWSGDLDPERPPGFFSAFDTSFLVMFLMSLIGLLFTFDAFSGEKSAGTLRLVMAHSVPFWELLSAKQAAASLCALSALLLGILGQFIYLVIYLETIAKLGLSWDDMARLGFILAISSLYTLVFIAAGTVVSILTRQPSVSAASCLLVWLFLTLLLPTLASPLAGQFFPIKSEQQIQTEKREAAKRIEKEYEDMGYPGLAHEDYGKIHPAAQPRIAAELARIDERQAASHRRHRGAAILFARLTPAGCLNPALSSVAGVGVEAMEAYYRELERVKQILRGRVEQALRDFDGNPQVRARPSRVLRALLRTPLTEARFLDLSLRQALSHAAMDCALLALFLAAGFSAAYACLLKYDPR